MKRHGPWLLLVFALSFALGHVACAWWIPRHIMGTTLSAMARGGERLNTFNAGRRVTPDSRRVVRPSPDLAYSACVYDLSDAPLHVRVPPWRHYWSVSLYAANSDNYATRNDRTDAAGTEFLLVGQDDPAPAVSMPVMRSPSATGVILIRRLMPDAAEWSALAPLREEDRCESWRG